MTKNLIIFYSRRGENYVNGTVKNLAKGNTRIVAEYIQKAVGGDLFEIETVKEYPADYHACTAEAKKELRENARPELKRCLDDIADYDNIIICGPCWWGFGGSPSSYHIRAGKSTPSPFPACGVFCNGL